MAAKRWASRDPASIGSHRLARLALGLALVAAATTSCATPRPVASEPQRVDPAPARTATTPRIVDETRRAEEAHERAAVSRPPRVEMAPGTPMPPVGATSRPLSELARDAGAIASPGRIVSQIEEIRFAPGQSDLDAASRAQLWQLAARLASAGAGYFLEVQGHTDAAGSEPDNLRVGLARAEAVRRYLHLTVGVPQQRIAVVSLGSSRPVADNATAEGRARNRRVVVLVSR